MATTRTSPGDTRSTQPDLVDVFKLELNPENKNQYKIDGEWLDFERWLAPLEVRLWRDFRWTVNREILYSIYGPAMRVNDQVFAIRYAGIGEFRQIEQWYRMGRAQSLGEFKDAMRIHALAMFNTGYGDRDGNIFYAYNALLPERAAGHDWSGTVLGNTRDTLWTEYRPFDELPIVENPKSGFIQNCNSDPFQTSLGADNPDEAAFSENYGIEKRMTNRARRAVELYGGDESITHEEFFRYKYDKLYSEKSELRLRIAAFAEAQAGNSELKEGDRVAAPLGRRDNERQPLRRARAADRSAGGRTQPRGIAGTKKPSSNSGKLRRICANTLAGSTSSGARSTASFAGTKTSRSAVAPTRCAPSTGDRRKTARSPGRPATASSSSSSGTRTANLTPGR